ncbi:MAG: cytochrome c [Hyphomicrobiaceae bacterium]
MTGIEAVDGWSSAVPAFVLLLAAIGVALPGSASELGANNGGSTEPARGQAIYQQHCARCHGRNLEGEPDWRRRKPNGRLPAPPHDHTGHTWHHSDDALFRVTKFGSSAVAGGTHESDMPGFEKVLSDDDIWAVIAFIKSRWPEDVRKRQETITRRAQR